MKLQEVCARTCISISKELYYLEEELEFDPITYKHCKNVGIYSTKLMKSAQYNVDEELMRYAGMFHDIGKIQIDMRILNKPGILTADEINSIKKHTSYGYNLLLQKGVPNEILTAAHLHHEKFDGTGYPLGLKGEEVPVIARAISICDVFDALTSDRPYRKAYSVNEALETMQDQFYQFDPFLLTIFMKNITYIVN